MTIWFKIFFVSMHKYCTNYAHSVVYMNKDVCSLMKLPTFKV